MLKQLIPFSFLILISISLLGCFSNSTPIDPSAATCLKLKREMAYDNYNMGYEADKLTKNQRAKAKQLYQQNHCN